MVSWGLQGLENGKISFLPEETVSYYIQKLTLLWLAKIFILFYHAPILSCSQDKTRDFYMSLDTLAKIG